MKFKIILIISFIMFIIGIYFSNKSNFMIVIAILGGGMVGYSSALIKYSSTKDNKNKKKSS